MPWWNDIDEALAEIPHAAVGAVAANTYMAPRFTFDLDLAIRARDQAAAREALTEAGYRLNGHLDMSADPKQEGLRWSTAEGQDFDVIALSHRWASRAIEEAQSNRPATAAGLPVLPLPYLVLMKAIVSRSTDTADLSRMLGAATPPQWEGVRRTVAEWRPQDLEDISSLREIGLWERGANGPLASPDDPDEHQERSW